MARKTEALVHLNKAVVERLEVPAVGRKYYYDDVCRGLAVCVTASGTRTFYLARRIGPDWERQRLGVFPQMTIEQARKQADKLNADVAAGVNPNDAVRRERQAWTLGEVFEQYLTVPTRTRSKRPKAPKTVHSYRLLWNAYLSNWAHRKLPTIQRDEIEKRHNELGESIGHHTANRCIVLVKALFNHALDCGFPGQNPASRVRLFEEQSRERFLQVDELPRFLQAIADEPNEKMRDFFLLCLYTGQRRGNIQEMRWEQLNFPRRLWQIPKTKSGRHECPLIDAAMEILERRYQSRGDSPWVFPGRHGREPLKDPMNSWRAICARAGVFDLRIHDLRRSIASWSAIGGTSLQIVGRMLGHHTATATQVYSRLSDDPVREAMTAAVNAMTTAGTAKPKPR